MHITLPSHVDGNFAVHARVVDPVGTGEEVHSRFLVTDERPCAASEQGTNHFVATRKTFSNACGPLLSDVMISKVARS